MVTGQTVQAGEHRQDTHGQMLPSALPPLEVHRLQGKTDQRSNYLHPSPTMINGSSLTA